MVNILNDNEEKKKKNIGSFPSLNQGNKFDKYQKKIKHNLEKKNKLLFAEGFENMDNLTEETNQAINQNTISSQELNNIDNLKQEYQNTLTEYENLINQISGNATNYINRVSSSNPYLNKTVGFPTGQLGYVTAQGIFKYIPSTTIQNSVNIPKTITPLNIQWNNSYQTPGTQLPTNPPLVSGTPVQSGQSFGNEGSNVYVDEMLPSDVNPTYMGCYAANSANNNMTFIGGSPPPPTGNLQNGNFTQPQISSNSYQYISSNSTVPGWDFYAVLINNSTAWGYPMPYPSGPQAACIQAGQIFGQYIELNPGIYTLSFNACGRPGYSGANTINVYCNISTSNTTPQASQPVYQFTPPTTTWQSYTTNISIQQSGNYALGFYGTINDPNNSTAIQGIQLTTAGSTNQGTYTYGGCQQAAINNGYQYFALQNVNPNTSKGYCAVSNNEPAITQYGNSTVPSKLTKLWSSKTSGQTGNSCILSVTGSLQVMNSSGQAVFSTPGTNAQPSNYLGCYGDGPKRAMTLYNGGSQQYNLQQCQQIAEQQGSQFFGLQNSSSGTNAQCALSNNFAQVSQYGKATNCTQISGGSYSGGGWSNAVYNTTNPGGNYYLTVQNNGNIVINRGTSPNDNQGQIWASGTNGNVQQQNPNYVASKGKYGQNWITQGQTLAAGDWIGSPNGSCALIMQGDGNLILYTFAMQENCQKMKDGNIGGGVGANAAYNIGIKAITGNIGNLAYVDANSEIHPYESSNQIYSNDYTEITGINSTGNDIQGAAFKGTQQQCAAACNSNPDCAGYVTNGDGTYCWPKSSGMYPYGGASVPNSDRNTYIRLKMPKTPPLGVSQNTDSTDTVTYGNYVQGGALENQYGLSQATTTQKQQLTQLQQKLDMLSQQINSSNSKFSSGVNTLQSQSQKNVQGLQNYLQNLSKTDNNIVNTSEMNNGNLENILNESDITVLQKNYSYLAWSILAAGTVLITMNLTKN